MPDQTTPTRNSVTSLLRAEQAQQATWPREPVTAFRALTGDPRNEIDPAAAAAAAAAAAQVDWDSPDNPYRQRFQDTQSAYTQGQQELARLKRYEEDPNAYYELGAKHGVQFEFENPNGGQGGGQQQAPDQTAQELAELRQWREQVDAERQAQQAAAGEELFHTDLDSWAKEQDVTLSQADHNAIFGLLMRSPDPTQESVARQIFEAHVAHKKAERDSWQQEYEEQRRRPRVPTPPAGGAAHTGAPNWREMSESEQNEYMAQRAAGHI